MIDDNQPEVIETSALAVSCRKEKVKTYKEDVVEEVDILNVHIAREGVIPKKIVIPCMVFQTKQLSWVNLKNQNLKFFMKRTKNFLGTT